MDLLPDTPDESFDVVKFTSRDGTWSLGARRMLYGVRVCAMRSGSMACSMDYCAGADRAFLQLLWLVAQAIFLALPEEITEGELERMLPRYKTKPINLDSCWEQLQQLAISLQERPANDLNPTEKS